MVRTFYLLSFTLGAATVFGIAVFVTAFSIVVIRSGALPKAIGWIGIVIAVVLVAAGGAVGSLKDGFFALQFGGFIAVSIWLFVVSIMMFRAVPTGADSGVPASAS